MALTIDRYIKSNLLQKYFAESINLRIAKFGIPIKANMICLDAMLSWLPDQMCYSPYLTVFLVSCSYNLYRPTQNCVEAVLDRSRGCTLNWNWQIIEMDTIPCVCFTLIYIKQWNMEVKKYRKYLSHLVPVYPSLQLHWPVVLSHIWSKDPWVLHAQSVPKCIKNS